MTVSFAAAIPPATPAAIILREVAYELGLPEPGADRVQATGRENLPSCFPVTDLAVAAIGAAGWALADLLGGEAEVMVDRHLASAWFGFSVKPLGWSLPGPWDAVAGDYRCADGWIRLHTNAPHHRAAALHVLGCAGEKMAVTAAVERWAGEALEQAVVDAGGCVAFMRSAEAWCAHPQGQAVAAEPLIAFSRTGMAKEGRWHPHPDRPLRGIRVLDLTRVLAGPVATRFLAGWGAEVLRLDPPGWDEPGVIPEVTLGKTCARLDLRDGEDRRQFEDLLAGADIMVHGYRPGALEGLGLGEAERRRINPGLIDVSLNAWGWSGPWAGRRGFDSLVQMPSGIAAAGMNWKGSDEPVPLPVQALDQATGYLMAAAVLRGLAVRQEEGCGTTARLSLARTAVALMGSGGEQKGQAFTGKMDADYAPMVEQTGWGTAQRLHPPVSVGGLHPAWDRPAMPLGSAVAGWSS